MHLFHSSQTVYGKGEEASLREEWDSCYLDTSEGGMMPKTEPYDDMYDDYSESSNIEWSQCQITKSGSKLFVIAIDYYFFFFV